MENIVVAKPFHGILSRISRYERVVLSDTNTILVPVGRLCALCAIVKRPFGIMLRVYEIRVRSFYT